jgi:hypothetical protein
VGDVSERAGMDKDGDTLEGLHRVWLGGVLHEDSEGNRGTNVESSSKQLRAAATA